MANSNFETAHEFSAHWEGGYSDHPADRGGPTNYGASLVFVQDIAKAASGRNFLQAINVQLPVTKETIRKLSLQQAKAMFKRELWDKVELELLPLKPAILIYDAALNHGPHTGVKLAQRGYNACVGFGQPLKVDGVMGPLTQKALKQVTPKIIRASLDARRKYYHDIVQAKPSQEAFLSGWLNRVNALEKYLEGLK